MQGTAGGTAPHGEATVGAAAAKAPAVAGGKALASKMAAPFAAKARLVCLCSFLDERRGKASRTAAQVASTFGASAAGAAAAAGAGPIGAVAGAAAGLAADVAIAKARRGVRSSRKRAFPRRPSRKPPQAVELVQRAELERDLRSAFDATVEEWCGGLEAELDRACKVWIDDAIQLTTASAQRADDIADAIRNK